MSTSNMSEQSQQLSEVVANLDQFHSQISDVARHLKESFAAGGKVLVAGNGGSAAEAQHFSDEMVGRYAKDRRPYPVIALTCDGAVLTCIGNDYGYEESFARQVRALGRQGDVFVSLSTSGTSPNLVAAAQVAREQGMTVVAFSGRTGTLRETADYAIEVPSDRAPRVQELHLHAIHLLCEEFEPED